MREKRGLITQLDNFLKWNFPQRIPLFYIFLNRQFFFHVCSDPEFEMAVPLSAWERNKRVVISLLEVIYPVYCF